MILYGVCDFVAVSSNEELAREYWGGQGLLLSEIHATHE